VTPSRILVIRLSALGDVVHTLPAVDALRRAFPQATIGWLVEAPNADLVRLASSADEIFVVATRRWRRRKLAASTRQELVASLRSLRQFAAGEWLVDFQGLLKSALLGRASGASVRFGFEKRSLREPLASLFINRPVAIDQSRHVVDWNMQLASGAGATADGVQWHLDRFAADPTGRFEPLARERPIVLNPGAGKAGKLWPLERFVELAGELIRRQYRVVVSWGPGELEMARSIASGSGAELLAETNLRELTFVLRSARLLVAGDTGPLHIAAALGTPVVGLFGPTDPRRNGPYGQIERCVESWTSDRRMSSIPMRPVLDRALEAAG
jgi:heptosyltransferase I